ncbi:MAG: class I SAM-dependent methyltransferase [Candidatus Paceibacterota bacterium]
MEEVRLRRKVLEMGESTSKVFSGESELTANKEAYAETGEFFADQIRPLLTDKDATYTIADIGSYKGELLGDIIAQLPEYRFHTIAVDTNSDALRENTANEKVVADAGKLPFQDRSIDIVIVRYLLQWNSPEKQQQILKEIARIVKKRALIEHAGAPVLDTEDWRRKSDTLFLGAEIPKMKREGHFFASREEVEQWMTEFSIPFERTKDRVIENAADIYIERYALNDGEAAKAKQILGDSNRFQQTDWALFPESE